MSENSPKLLLVDAMALVYRAHFAFLKNPRVNTQGFNTGAILGFTNVLVQLLEKERPTHAAIAFDRPEPTFRHVRFAPYKAHRSAQPKEITAALPYIKEMAHAFGVPVWEQPGYEADDIVGTVAQRAAAENFLVYMVTPDKDFAQLVTERVLLYKPSLGRHLASLWGPAEVLGAWGIQRSDQVCDLLALQGDASDNIPGVPGIGPKTAQQLIEKFDCVEHLLSCTHQLPARWRALLEKHADQAKLSKELATICKEVPGKFSLSEAVYRGPNPARLQPLLEMLEFRSLQRRLAADHKLSPFKASSAASVHPEPGAAGSPAMPRVGEDPKTIATVTHNYQLVDTPEGIEALAKRLLAQEAFCFDTETTGLNPHRDALVGVAFALHPHEAYYIPLDPEDVGKTRVSLRPFHSCFASDTVRKVGQNLKFDISVLYRYGIPVRGPWFDTMLAHALLWPQKRHSLQAMALEYLNYKVVEIESLIGPRGSIQQNMASLNVHQVKEYAGEDADITLQLYRHLAPEIERQHMAVLLEEIEHPLLEVLSAMERTGVRVDTEVLRTMAQDLEESSEALAEEIYALAGKSFNISSSKQVGALLFDTLQLPTVGTTQTGQPTTRETALSALAQHHEIVAKILEHRGLQKLQSTYLETLPAAISPHDQKIHTSYHQAVVYTGRLSSSQPNLQNIPVRTEKGRKIRKAFVPSRSDFVLLSADYSQIELRVVAAFSQDPVMKEAFVKGQDIHSAMASQLFEVPLEHVTAEMRRRAKTANFGIIYGVSSVGLSQQLGISKKEAAQLISAYFERFSGLRTYFHQTLEIARKQGFVRTHMGRKVWLSGLASGNASVRKMAERMAINAPIQGTAAEIIKRAMIDLHRWMQRQGLRSRMLLQVHDELIFEVHPDETMQLEMHVPALMRAALPLSVPMQVSCKWGPNWLEMRQMSFTAGSGRMASDEEAAVTSVSS